MSALYGSACKEVEKLRTRAFAWNKLALYQDAAGFIREALGAAIQAHSTKPKEHEIFALNQRMNELQNRLKGSRKTKITTASWSNGGIWLDLGSDWRDMKGCIR